MLERLSRYSCKTYSFLTGAERLHLFYLVSAVPDQDSATANSKQFTSTPHVAGTDEDFRTAKDLLNLIQSEFGISAAGDFGQLPIFDAGSEASRSATLDIPSLTRPTAWIDTYYPLLNYPNGASTLEILDKEGNATWKAKLPEQVPEDGSSPEEQRFANAIPPFHGYSRNGTARVRISLFFQNNY